MDYKSFEQTVWAYYHTHGRDLPWRHAESDGKFDAYKIMVSEIMLQQTQVTRVIEKYRAFLEVFPTVQTLASATLAEVLVLWSGLGYNRRAKFLWQAASQLADQPQPWSFETLVACPGIGPNTAAAIVTYAYNQAQPFIETNVRTVYIHHFFADDLAVSDAAIKEILEATYDHQQPREFFWALMDYGSHLKQTVGNVSRQSKHYAKQSKFEGSRRQIRGAILKQLALKPQSLAELQDLLPDERLAGVLQDLVNEGFIAQRARRFHLGGH